MCLCTPVSMLAQSCFSCTRPYCREHGTEVCRSPDTRSKFCVCLPPWWQHVPRLQANNRYGYWFWHSKHSIITQGLQCPLADFQFPADILMGRLFDCFILTFQVWQIWYSQDKLLDLVGKFLEDLFLITDYFHCFYIFIITHVFRFTSLI